MIKILVLCMAVFTTVGCAASQTKTPAFAKASAKETVTVKKDVTTIKQSVIAIEIKRADMRLVYEETFDQPTTVKRGACPKRSFLPDGSVMPKLDECLVWSLDIGTVATAIRSDWIVTYRFASVVSAR